MQRNSRETFVSPNTNQRAVRALTTASILPDPANSILVPRLIMQTSKRAIVLSTALMGMFQLSPVARAATLLFDADGAGATASGGTGTWDTTSSIWRLTNASGALQTWTNGGGDLANLGGAAGTLTIADLTTITGQKPMVITGLVSGIICGNWLFRKVMMRPAAL